MKEEKGEIISGYLLCRCKEWFPIISGIPRLLHGRLKKDLIKTYQDFFAEYQMPDSISEDNSDRSYTLKKKTSKSFGYQWVTFSDIFSEFEENFLGYISPLTPDSFNGKTVLDMGCGFGRHTFFAAKYGAEVIGMDLSEAVVSAYANTREFPNAHIIQGDIYQPPFKKCFDLIFSIGVLHHLPDPREGFRMLVDLLKSNDEIFIWVYNRTSFTKYAEALRSITTRLPLKVLYALTYLHAAMVHYVFNGLYLRNTNLPLPFKYYAKFPFEVKHADVFDRLSVPITYYYKKADIEEWFDNDFKDSWVISREDGGGIKGYGKKGDP